MHIKTIIAGSIALLCLWSCQDSDPPIDEDDNLEHQSEALIHSIEVGDLEVLTIEGCEYLVYKEGDGPNHAYGYMAHKGNCSNPIHCRAEMFSLKDSIFTPQHSDQ